MLNKDLKNMCNLYELNIKLIDRNNYINSIKDKMDMNVLRNVLDNLIYIDTGEIRTKEDYTMVMSQTQNQYECIKNFNLEDLFKGINDLSLEKYHAKKIIVDMIILRVFIIYADIYTPKRYDNMLDRLYS